MNIILDACALIAFFRNELGAEIVENYLSDNQYTCMIHGINLCEVYYDFLRTGGETIADNYSCHLLVRGNFLFPQLLAIVFIPAQSITAFSVGFILILFYLMCKCVLFV